MIDFRIRRGQSGSPVIVHRNGDVAAMVGGGVVAVPSGAMTDFIGVYSCRINKDSDIDIVSESFNFAGVGRFGGKLIRFF